MEYRKFIVAGADFEMFGAPAGSGNALNTPDEDAAGSSVRLGDEVQAVVHTVDQIDVSPARRTVNYLSPGSDAARSVGRLILKPQVGFDLHDGECFAVGYEEFAQKVPGNSDSIATVERLREYQLVD